MGRPGEDIKFIAINASLDKSFCLFGWWKYVLRSFLTQIMIWSAQLEVLSTFSCNTESHFLTAKPQPLQINISHLMSATTERVEDMDHTLSWISVCCNLYLCTTLIFNNKRWMANHREQNSTQRWQPPTPHLSYRHISYPPASITDGATASLLFHNQLHNRCLSFHNQLHDLYLLSPTTHFTTVASFTPGASVSPSSHPLESLLQSSVSPTASTPHGVEQTPSPLPTSLPLRSLSL